MKPQLKIVRKREIRGRKLGATDARAGGEKLAHPDALLFEVIEEPFGPDKFGGQNAETERNREPARPGRDDHRDAEEKERETEGDFQTPDHFVNRPAKQRPKSRPGRMALLIGRTPINLPRRAHIGRGICTQVSIARGCDDACPSRERC